TIIAIYIYYLYADRSILLAASFLLLLCSIYLAYICELNIMQEKNIIRQRDTSVEHELLIEENNRQIIANQDATIYMATLKERNRIAREIHDNVGHMLTRSILQVGALKTLNNDEKLIEPITNLQSTLNSAMTSIRTSVHDLHDDSIDLKSSIEALANDVSRLKVIVDYDMTENIPRDIKYSFITITKEAINNAEKYSNGDTITVLLREHPGFYQLMISDNGTDIDIKDTGIGLTGMRDRVAALNGTIKITTTDGFNILVSVMKRS
ncbi:MAG: sensor histidine kinase, partial [Coprococcus sp.]